MANNELSGPLVSLALAKHFSKKVKEKTLRFIFVPETIGAITYLSKNLNKIKKILLGAMYFLALVMKEITLFYKQNMVIQFQIYVPKKLLNN